MALKRATKKKPKPTLHEDAPEMEMVGALVGLFKVLRSDASAAVRTAVTKKASLEDMKVALKTTLDRHDRRPFDKPIAFWISECANVVNGTPSPPLEAPKVEPRSWGDMRGGAMKPIGALLAAKLEESKVEPPSDVPDAEEDGPNCKLCADAGYVRKAISDRSHPDFGRVFPCSCRGRSLAERVVQAKEWSGLSPLQMQMRFRGTELLPGVTAAIDTCKQLLRGEILQIVFQAPPGRGKTRLASATLMEHLAKGNLGLYVNVPSYLEELRDTYNRETPETYMQVIRPALTWPLVVLDDLGGEKKSQWTEQTLYEIIDARYRAGLKTIACTNADPYAMDERIVSRLLDKDRGVVIEFKKKDTIDYRRGKQ